MGVRYVLTTGKHDVIDSSTSIDAGVIQASDIDDAALGNGLQGGYKSEDQTSAAVSVKLNEGAFTPQGSGLQVGANGMAFSTYAMGRVTSFHAVHSGSTSVAANAADATITPVDWNSQNITIVANSIIYVRATITALQTTGTVGSNGAGWMMQAVIRRAATGNAELVDTSFVNHAFKDAGFSNITPTIALASNVLTITCPSSTSIGINYKVTCEVLSTITVE